MGTYKIVFLFLCVTFTKNGTIILEINDSFVLVVSPPKELSISIISIPEINAANSNNGFLPINSFPYNIILGFLFSKNLKIFITVSIFSFVIFIYVLSLISLPL